MAIATILMATGCGGSDSTPKSLLSKPTGAKLAADFGGSGPATLTAAFAIQDLDFDLRDASNLAARITYMSTSGVDNSLVPVTGAVFVPWGEPPSRDGWPAVALGHATTGVKPECAPSLSRNISNLAPTIVALLKVGFVVTVPDYQGLGSEQSFTRISTRPRSATT